MTELVMKQRLVWIGNNELFNCDFSRDGWCQVEEARGVSYVSMQLHGHYRNHYILKSITKTSFKKIFSSKFILS